VQDARYRAKLKWLSNKFPGEDEDGANLQVWGRHAPFENLLTELPAKDSGSGEPDRFADLATRLWFPLLEHEQRALL